MSLDPRLVIRPEMDPSPDEIPAFKWPDRSPYAREMRSWETKNRIPDWTPEKYRYPIQLFKASRHTDEAGNPTGKWMVNDPYDDNFTAQNCRNAKDEAEELMLKGQGWASSPGEALARATQGDDEIARVAAHRLYEDRKMSEAAKAEARAIDEATFDHVPEIPEKPKARRGRPRKSPATPAA